MIHPLLSIQAHYQAFMLRHFKHSLYGHYMKSIHNTHLGESCFLIGNGPSLKVADLEVLGREYIDSFAFNRIYKIFPQTEWRPTYYMNTDDVLIRDVLPEIEKMDVPFKFTSIQNKFYHGIHFKGAHYFYCNDNRKKDPPEGFSLDCTEQINRIGTVTISAIQMAIHMGYRNIYLLGIDHNFDTIITENGEIKVDPSVQNYFIKDYDTDIAGEVTHDIGHTTKGYMRIQKFCLDNGINVYNSSRQTKLTVFEQVPFEDALNQIRQRGK